MGQETSPFHDIDILIVPARQGDSLASAIVCHNTQLTVYITFLRSPFMLHRFTLRFPDALLIPSTTFSRPFSQNEKERIQITRRYAKKKKRKNLQNIVFHLFHYLFIFFIKLINNCSICYVFICVFKWVKNKNFSFYFSGNWIRKFIEYLCLINCYLFGS